MGGIGVDGGGGREGEIVWRNRNKRAKEGAKEGSVRINGLV